MSDSSLNAEDLNDSSSASYVIVQEQMRDLLIIQETVIGDVAKANVRSFLKLEYNVIDVLQVGIGRCVDDRGIHIGKLRRQIVGP